jgi:tetratricopeptide (TPR) repeat protein
MNNCPESSEQMYIDGVTMYRSFIDSTPDLSAREGLIDTLMLIYDRRMDNFGDEGNVLGRKGRDLLNYRGADIEEVQKAYEMLEKSIEIQGNKTPESVLLLSISAGIRLNNEGRLEDSVLVEDYITAIGVLIKQERRSSRWEETRDKIQEIMTNEDLLSCEAFDKYFDQRFEQNKNDKDFLDQVIMVYSTSGCENSDIYAAASENLYNMKPSPETARNLAFTFISRGDYEKAADYLTEAVQGDNINRDTRAGWYYELAVLSSANGDFCETIAYARDAIMLNSNLGKAYMLLGDAYIGSRENLGDDFEKRTAFWAASDMYEKAGTLDPDLREEANRKLKEYREFYPNHEDVFFRDLKEGDSYLVEGCINAYTYIRSGE